MPSSLESKPLRSFLAFLLTFLTAVSGLSAQNRIEWEEVVGADHYRVEIRRNDELVLETRSNQPALPLFLPPGDYRFQVKAINSFGKIAAESEWGPLKISTAQRPFIVSFSPRRIHENANTAFLVRAEGWSPDTRFLLENGNEKQITLSSEPQADGTIILRSEKRQPIPGVWKLLMINENRSDSMEAALTVTESLHPRIKDFSPREFSAGKIHNQAVIKIAGLEDGAHVIFTGPSEIPSTLIRRQDEKTLEYSLNLSNAMPGRYGLKVANPSGNEDEKKRAFEVTPAPPTPEEIAAALRLPIDDKPILPPPPFPRSILVGWNMTIPIGGTSEYFRNGYAGLSISFSQAFRNSLFRRISLFNDMEWGFSFIYNQRPTSYPLIDLTLQQFSFLIGIRYITPFDFPLNLLIRTDAGPSLSVLSSPDVSRDELRDGDSIDFTFRFGIAAHIDINPRWIIDLGCDFPVTFFLSRTSWSVQPRLEGGYRW